MINVIAEAMWHNYATGGRKTGDLSLICRDLLLAEAFRLPRTRTMLNSGFIQPISMTNGASSSGPPSFNSWVDYQLYLRG